MQKIFCFGDGFATGHIWPEWPQILEVLLPDYKIINTAGIGAGTEFLVSGFVDLIDQLPDSTIIFQWPKAERFDKMIVDSSWQTTIANDPVYHFNVVTDQCDRKWWLSSASTTQDIRDYHSKFVQSLQHTHRQNMYKQLVTHTAKNLNCQLMHTDTCSQDKFSLESRFNTTRQQQVQPSPIVHFYWLVEKIVPELGIKVDTKLQGQLETLINQTQWIPYDPDREEIWSKLKQQLSD